MGASATLRPQSGFLLNADQIIDVIEEEKQCISCSLHQRQLTLLAAQSNTFVLRKIWHHGLLDHGRRGSFASAAMLCSSPTALRSPLQPGRQSLEGFQRFTRAQLPLTVSGRAEGTPAEKAKGFTSFTWEDLRALLDAKPRVKQSFPFWRDSSMLS